MPIIIDGWNLIRSDGSAIDDSRGDSIEAAISLIGELNNFQTKHKDPIILVFDSTNEYLGIKHVNTDKLKVVASSNADDYIKRYIDAFPERQRGGLRVVSSDKDVYYYAKSGRAVPIRSDEFWAKLNRRDHVQGRD